MVVGSAAAAATVEKDLSENLLWWCAKNEGVQEKKGKEENRERVGCHFARKSETYGLFPLPWHTEYIKFTKSILKIFFGQNWIFYYIKKYFYHYSLKYV